MKTFLKDKAIPICTLVLIAGLIFFAYGCEPKAVSLLDPSRMVSTNELKAEFEYLKSQLENRLETIEQKRQFKDLILQQGLTFTATGQIDPVGLATSIIALLGIGAAADNVRVRKKLKVATNGKSPNPENS